MFNFRKAAMPAANSTAMNTSISPLWRSAKVTTRFIGDQSPLAARSMKMAPELATRSPAFRPASTST